MLKPIRTFYIEGVPAYADFCEACNIAREESCVVELRWRPNLVTGWQYKYICATSDPETLVAQTSRCYGV